ncbi:MAG: C45 family peptidase [Alistipes sp.]|jgi:hypothetical protein|nr:C45 family peptidase [Alistipes sp.]
MRKTLKYMLVSLAVPVALVVLLVVAVTAVTGVWYLSADMKQPDVRVDTLAWPVAAHDGYVESRGALLRQSDSGLWEAWVQGAPVERGVALGRVSRDLLYYQERVFVDQIRRIVPSDGYLRFLRYLLIGFNRHLGESVTEEFRKEIYGVSLSCTREFDAIGTPYERQLNYHAAHDIGHTMQEYMLVGCSSFAAWGGTSADSMLIVGRNFDFWVGDDFARNRVIALYAPDAGYRFASVTWPGMAGVLSGMNERGLTVTINAAKGTPPTASATPISLLAREILQYAATIDEAVAIAARRRTFVSESLLIGSAAEGCAAIIEKTPRLMALHSPAPGDEFIICTNHFQSPELADDKHNVENIASSDSPWRWRRLAELIPAETIDPVRAADILRDSLGVGGTPLPAHDPRRIAQPFAHHSVIFKPAELLMWVSTGMGHGGEYVCYDLGRIFASPTPPDFSTEIRTESLTIPAER